MLRKIFRAWTYVYFRLSRQQRKVIRDRNEADWSAIFYFSIPPAVSALFLDALRALLLGGLPLSQQINSWLYAIALFGLVFFVHYILLRRENRIDTIYEEFSGAQPYGPWGTWIVLAYFVVPILALVGVHLAR